MGLLAKLSNYGFFLGNAAMGRGQHSLQRVSYILCTVVFLIITLCLFMQTESPLPFLQGSDFILIDGAQDNVTDIVSVWLERRNNLVSYKYK